jgi:sulfate transport system substrate-binding protein
MTQTLSNLKPSRRGVLSAAAGGAALATVPGLLGGVARAASPLTLLNVSYDPTRELYKEINAAFAGYWKGKTGQAVTINQSHNGSGASARAVIDGLQADVVTLALADDIDQIARKAKLLPLNWQTRLPNNSTPYTSTVVFLVHKGNPWKIHDWGDLLKRGISVITSNPKTSGGGRWAYLAAYAYGLSKGGDAAAKDYIRRLYQTVPVLDTGARGSTTTFAKRGLGDVLLCWENEAYLTIGEFGPNYEIIYPSRSIYAEPPVAVVDKNVDRHKTRAVAEAYLNFLYTAAAQDIIGKHHFRPTLPAAKAKYAGGFKQIPMVTVNDTFGGWANASKVHFADGGLFDQLYKPS